MASKILTPNLQDFNNVRDAEKSEYIGTEHERTSTILRLH